MRNLLRVDWHRNSSRATIEYSLEFNDEEVLSLIVTDQAYADNKFNSLVDAFTKKYRDGTAKREELYQAFVRGLGKLYNDYRI